MALVWLTVPTSGALAVAFALWLARDVLRRDVGTPEMQRIGGMIFEGAMAFLQRQYRTIAIFAVVTSVVVGVLVGIFDESAEHGILTAVAFLVVAWRYHGTFSGWIYLELLIELLFALALFGSFWAAVIAERRRR